MMHLLLQVSKDDYSGAVTRPAKDQSIWASGSSPTADPGVQRMEFTVGDATLEVVPAEVAESFAGLKGR